ncbi:MAG: class B sortase [Oscillospiraceae bacterium]|nr:class B sortase [Oscillospiraceae bacterium]
MLKVIGYIDRATDIVLLLFFLILVLIGGYTMYDTVLIYDLAGGDDLRSFKPLITDVENGGWDMSALSPDVVAWLTVDGTNIDYPVLQGHDNNEYLNKDPFGGYSLSGSIFLDARNASDFSDPYSLIYGHHMEYGKMFGALDDFLDEDYFEAHRTATLIVSDRVYAIKFFACIEADSSVNEIFAPNETQGTLSYVQKNAAILREPEGDKLIALSTCKFPQTTERIIVFGVLKDEQ